MAGRGRRGRLPRRVARPGEAAPRPYEAGTTHPRSGTRASPRRAPPVCRGQALPDPSGPAGPADRHRGPSAICQAHRRRPTCATAFPAPSGAAGRGSASPLRRWGGCTRRGTCLPHGWAARSRPVGVRRCLTRRPARAGVPRAERRAASAGFHRTGAWSPVAMLSSVPSGVGAGRRDPVAWRARAGGNAGSVSDPRGGIILIIT